jgi:hypothetical protein
MEMSTKMCRPLIPACLLFLASTAIAQQPSECVGQKVLIRHQTTLKVGNRVVDDRSPFRIFTVEQTSGQ